MNTNQTRTRRRMAGALLGVLLLAAGPPASAAEAPRIQLTITAEKLVVAEQDGVRRETRVPAGEVALGDTLIYTLHYTNAGAGAARDVDIVDPVPAGTVLVPKSAAGDAAITFSINGGKDYKPYPVKYTIVKPDGTRAQVDAPAAMYTHVKWRVAGPIAPGAGGQLSFRAIAR